MPSLLLIYSYQVSPVLGVKLEYSSLTLHTNFDTSKVSNLKTMSWKGKLSGITAAGWKSAAETAVQSRMNAVRNTPVRTNVYEQLLTENQNSKIADVKVLYAIMI